MSVSILSVAEKPSVAKELANIFRSSHSRAGHSKYNRLFDVNSCEFRNNKHAKMTITSVSGHVMGTEFTDAHRSWKACQPVDLFTAPIVRTVNENSKNIEKTLKEEARKHNVLLLWLDCDLEGEAIAYEVIKICQQANNRLDIFRARFSALIPRDIFRTMREPDRPNENMNACVEARQELDLRLGAAFTRFQTLRLQNRYEGLENVISYGPCQFPTLGFIIERHIKIEKFVAQSFWYIGVDHEALDPDNPTSVLKCDFTWDRKRVYDSHTCELLLEVCTEQKEDGSSGIATVTSINAHKTTRDRPVPLNTVEMQKRASRYLRIGSERAMKVAEDLYQRGILSYPRTETDFFKEGFDLTPFLENMRVHSVWGRYANGLLNDNKFLWPRHGGHDDQAHPPIHPTKNVELNELKSDDERKVYELVCRHFLACCSHAAKGDQTTIKIMVAHPLGESFTSTGLMITQRNWYEIYTYEKWNGKRIPVFKLGDTFTPKNIYMREGSTSAPEKLSESQLIELMDKGGIGTDATIAQHIATIQTREYVVKDNSSKFTPTRLGLALFEGYNDIGYALTKPHLRAHMEVDCKAVARGEMQKQVMIDKHLNNMKMVFLECTNNAIKLDQAVEKYYGRGAGGAGGVAEVGGVFGAFGGDGGFGGGGGPGGGNQMHGHADVMVNAKDFEQVRARFSKCGVCEKMMSLRKGPGPPHAPHKERNALYCSSCDASYNLPSTGEITNTVKLKRDEVKGEKFFCAICRFQVLTATFNGEKQVSWSFCPKCFNNAPPPPDAEDADMRDFKCFQCAHQGCELAKRTVGGEVNITACSDRNCSGQMRVKKVTGDKLMLACSAGRDCTVKPWWMPKFVKTAVPLPDEQCVECMRRHMTKVLKMKFTINMNLAPQLEPEMILCPSCSNAWSDTREKSLKIRSNRAVMSPGLPGKGSMNAPIEIVDVDVENQLNTAPRFRQQQQAQKVQQAPLCVCLLPAVTGVISQGPQAGKTFYSCSQKNTSNDCGFLKFEGEDPFDMAGIMSPPEPSQCKQASHVPTNAHVHVLDDDVEDIEEMEDDDEDEVVVQNRGRPRERAPAAARGRGGRGRGRGRGRSRSRSGGSAAYFAKKNAAAARSRSNSTPKQSNSSSSTSKKRGPPSMKAFLTSGSTSSKVKREKK